MDCDSVKIECDRKILCVYTTRTDPLPHNYPYGQSSSSSISISAICMSVHAATVSSKLSSKCKLLSSSRELLPVHLIDGCKSLCCEVRTLPDKFPRLRCAEPKTIKSVMLVKHLSAFRSTRITQMSLWSFSQLCPQFPIALPDLELFRV
jgi:hypothetical protein